MIERDINLRDVEGTLAQQGETAAAGALLCDTAKLVVAAAQVVDSTLIRLEGDEIIKSSEQVAAKLREIRRVNRLGGDEKLVIPGDKKLVVPTTMVVRNRAARDPQEEGSEKLLLLSSIGHYDPKAAARILDCDPEDIGYEGIDLRAVTGREEGECSVIMGTEVLSRFEEVHFGERLKHVLGWPRTIVAYSVGDRQFLCMRGGDFTAGYREVSRRAGFKSNI